MSDPCDAPTHRYDRAYLLGEPKRNDVLTLQEVIRYGADSFDDPDYVTLYGLKPADWYARGLRLLARTAVECTRDALADRIGRDVAAAAKTASAIRRSVVVDPFAGSANTLFWLARHLRTPRAIGFELDDRVFAATRRNLAIVGFDADLRHVDYEAGLRALRVARDELLVVFVAPPWGDALNPVVGLDLRHTQPPVTEIIDLVARTFAPRAVLLAIQAHETVGEESLAEVRARCPGSSLTFYDLNAAGENHGIVVADELRGQSSPTEPPAISEGRSGSGR
jgi:16S rRNA G966 N2-methylase RsmD